MVTTTISLSEEAKKAIDETREKMLPKLNMSQFIEKAVWKEIERIKRQESK